MKQQKTKHPASNAEQIQLTRGKTIIFNIIIFLFPFVLLLLFEVVLRFAEYGGNLDLVNKKSIGGKEFYVINRGVGKRYFAHSGTSIPEPADDKFEVHKSKKTKRIFCLGESTMAGFPYDFNATAPSFLSDRLATLLPDYHVEIINLGLSAISSYVILDFMKELIAYEPDLFIVYSGHNEFYGAYGVGSAVNIPGGELVTRLTISLLRYKTFLLMRDGYAWTKRFFSTVDLQNDVTFMEQMVGQQAIPYHSHSYNDAREAYNHNIAVMITLAQRHAVPIMFSALVSNLSNQPPFIATFSKSTSTELKDNWQKAIIKGDSVYSQQRFDEAKQFYRTACTIDSLNAAGWFKLGKTYAALEKFDSAKIVFVRAKDFDELRFRASQEFENDLQTMCEQFSVPVARVDSTFTRHSPNNIIGNTIILEHLHPNIDGYFLMAKTFFKTIVDNNLLVSRDQWRWSVDKSDEEFKRISGVTEFDKTYGEIKIDILTHSWPFSNSPIEYFYQPKNSVERIVGEYVKGKTGWSEARYTLSEYFAEKKDFENARRECFAIHKIIPSSYQPLLRIADYYRAEQKNAEAIAAYIHCFETEENPYARIKLSIIYIEQGNYIQSVEQLVKVFSTSYTNDKKLTSQAESSARYLLAVAYGKQNNFSAAREQLQYALVLQPDYGDAKGLLNQINDNIRK